MKRFPFEIFLLAALALLPVPGPARAAESYDACTASITTFPATISTPGTYCLDASHALSLASGSAIAINASHVTLDCNGFMLDNRTAGPSTTAIGVSSTDRYNIVVRHCDIRGFLMGLRMYGPTGGHVIEDNRFLQNTYIGLNVHGNGSVVRRNLVLDTGTTTSADFAVGIYTANSVDITENLVSGVFARIGGNGNAYGIFTEANPSGNITANRIRGLTRQGGGSVWGNCNSNSGRITIADNDLVSLSPTNAYGLRCQNNQGSSTGNIINGFIAGHINCSPDGGNLVAP